MENAWELFLRQLASADPEFTYDDVCGWSTDEFDALTGAGLISEMAQSTHLLCDVCPEAHREHVRWTNDGMRAFTTCPVAGTTEVNLEDCAGGEPATRNSPANSPKASRS